MATATRRGATRDYTWHRLLLLTHVVTALAIVAAVVAILVVKKLKLIKGLRHLNREPLLLGVVSAASRGRVLQIVGLL